MANQADADGARPRRRQRRANTPIHLGSPEVVPIKEADYRQAVTALATMIIEWWRLEEGRPPE